VRKIIVAISVILLLTLGVFFFAVPSMVERSANRVVAVAPSNIASETLHRRLLVADLHADSLLWDRDLLTRSAQGHVDIPRLIEGHVALQAFTLVTKAPRNLNIERNAGDTDNITLLAMAQRWPWAAIRSLKERALLQAKKLHEIQQRSAGKLTIIKSAADLESYLKRREQTSDITAGFLGVEGMHCLEGNPDNVEVMFNAGIRMMAPTHFFDTEIGGSAHGVNKGGLTDMGREVIRRMEAKRLLVDLAHASSKTIDDVLAMATRPVVVSHTGVRGTCDNQRNLSDDQLRRIASTGGVIGIGFWDTATCGNDAQAIARAIRHAVNVAGVERVGLGSDFDGAVTTPFDVSRIGLVTDALVKEGFSEHDIRLIMGGNVIRLLKATLP
jgi:microsomal dipeptidase-like Zn-dependent dipeptidase